MAKYLKRANARLEARIKRFESMQKKNGKRKPGSMKKKGKS